MLKDLTNIEHEIKIKAKKISKQGLHHLLSEHYFDDAFILHEPTKHKFEQKRMAKYLLTAGKHASANENKSEDSSQTNRDDDHEHVSSMIDGVNEFYEKDCKNKKHF